MSPWSLNTDTFLLLTIYILFAKKKGFLVTIQQPVIMYVQFHIKVIIHVIIAATIIL